MDKPDPETDSLITIEQKFAVFVGMNLMSFDVFVLVICIILWALVIYSKKLARWKKYRNRMILLYYILVCLLAIYYFFSFSVMSKVKDYRGSLLEQHFPMAVDFAYSVYHFEEDQNVFRWIWFVFGLLLVPVIVIIPWAYFRKFNEMQWNNVNNATILMNLTLLCLRGICGWWEERKTKQYLSRIKEKVVYYHSKDDDLKIEPGKRNQLIEVNLTNTFWDYEDDPDHPIVDHSKRFVFDANLDEQEDVITNLLKVHAQKPTRPLLSSGQHIPENKMKIESGVKMFKLSVQVEADNNAIAIIQIRLNLLENGEITYRLQIKRYDVHYEIMDFTVNFYDRQEQSEVPFMGRGTDAGSTGISRISSLFIEFEENERILNPIKLQEENSKDIAIDPALVPQINWANIVDVHVQKVD